jgi:hypothetical protein
MMQAWWKKGKKGNECGMGWRRVKRQAPVGHSRVAHQNDNHGPDETDPELALDQVEGHE